MVRKTKQPVIESSARPKTRPPLEVARKTTKRKGRALVEVVGIGLLVSPLRRDDALAIVIVLVFLGILILAAAMLYLT